MLFSTLLCRTEEQKLYAVVIFLVLYSILLLNIVCLLQLDICDISIYAWRATRQMTFDSLGSPSENKVNIIII